MRTNPLQVRHIATLLTCNAVITHVCLCLVHCTLPLPKKKKLYVSDGVFTVTETDIHTDKKGL